MAIQRKKVFLQNGEEDPYNEKIYSDLGLSLLDLKTGVVYPYFLTIRKGTKLQFTEVEAEAGEFPPERMEGYKEEW